MGNAGGVMTPRGRSASNPPQLYGDPSTVAANGASIQYTHAQMQALFISRGRADMGFIQSQLHSVLQPAPEMQETTTVRNDVNIKKQSVKLVQDDTGGYHLEFIFDSAKSCTIKIYISALETIDNDGNSTFESKKIVFSSDLWTKVYPAQLGQSFETPQIDLSTWTSSELVSTADSEMYPVVIEIQVVKESESEKTQKQATFLSLQASPDGKYKAQVIKQKVEVQGQTYELQEIYGMEGACCAAPPQSTLNDPNVSGAISDSMADGAECIICMCEPRNTTILPCRHMCICLECSEALKKPGSTCPICRGKVESMLQIRVNNSDMQQSIK